MIEIFRNFNERCQVSNLGRVMYDGVLLKECIGEPYNYVSFDGNNYRVHILVGQTFPDVCGEFKKHYHYHHLNRNQKDNRAENIVCLSPSEHKRLHQKEDGVSVGVVAYDKKENRVGEWDSKMQASEETGICYRHITDVVNEKGRRFTAGGYYWFKSDMSEDEIKEKILYIQLIKNQGNRKIS